jgi:hypothetical protein
VLVSVSALKKEWAQSNLSSLHPGVVCHLRRSSRPPLLPAQRLSNRSQQCLFIRVSLPQFRRNCRHQSLFYNICAAADASSSSLRCTACSPLPATTSRKRAGPLLDPPTHSSASSSPESSASEPSQPSYTNFSPPTSSIAPIAMAYRHPATPISSAARHTGIQPRANHTNPPSGRLSSLTNPHRQSLGPHR